MADPHAPYEPLDVPRPVADDVWIVDGPIVAMSLPLVSVPFPSRMTIVRLADGGLWLHSPTPPTDALVARIAALGPVRHLVSPNRLHYASIGAWKARVPEATAWASPGVRERAASQRIAAPFDADLGEEPPPVWAGQLDQLVFRGSWFVDEVTFFHRPSRTLVLTDLIQNFEPERLAQPWRAIFGAAGATAPDGRTPLDFRLTFLGRHADARACRDRMLAWAPERVLLAHGRWYDRDGEAELRRALRWLG